MITSFITEQGGVGKTSLCYHLGWYLASQGHSVLLVDIDPQGCNLSFAMGVVDKDDKPGMRDILAGDVDIKDCIIPLTPNLSIIPGNGDSAAFESIQQVVMEKKLSPKCIREVLDKVRDDYEYIFIDEGPSPSIVHWLVLSSVDDMVIPLIPDGKSIDGTKSILETYEVVKKTQNPNLRVRALVFNMFDQRSNLSKVVYKQMIELARAKGIPVAQTKIKQNAPIRETYIAHEGITTYNPSCVGAKNYKELSTELFGV